MKKDDLVGALTKVREDEAISQLQHRDPTWTLT
jgi:hypothetical protein